MTSSGEDSQAVPRSILIVLPTWVGDFVMATPTLRAIRTRFAGAHITFLSEPNLRDLVRGGDWMDECIEWPVRKKRSLLHREYRALVWNLRRRRFEWAVLLPNSFRSVLVTRMAGVKRRIGYDRDGRGLLLTDRLPLKNRRARGGKDERRRVCADRASDASSSHVQTRLPVPLGPFMPMPIVEYYAELAEALGCERPGDKLELFTTPDCDEAIDTRLRSLGLGDPSRASPLVVISPGAKYGAAKCWPPDRFAGVADRLIESVDAAVMVTCGPGEEPIARSIGSSMRKRGLILDDPPLTLGELKSLIRRSDLLICNDAGPRHLAKAFDIPVVTIFGPTHPEWTATRYPQERIVRIDVDCGPCQQRVCPLGHVKCMTGVTVDAVFEAAAQLLQDRAATVSDELVHG